MCESHHLPFVSLKIVSPQIYVAPLEKETCRQSTERGKRITLHEYRTVQFDYLAGNPLAVIVQYT